MTVTTNSGNKTAGVGDFVTNSLLTGAGLAAGGAAGAGLGGAAGTAGGVALADFLARHRHGDNTHARINYLRENAGDIISRSALLGTGLGAVTGGLFGGTLGSRFGRMTQRAADMDNDKGPKPVYLAAPPTYVPPPSLHTGARWDAAKFSAEDPEDPLLKRIEQNTGDKGQAIAIAKSKGWVKQNGKHLELTGKGKKPAKKAKSTLSKKSGEQEVRMLTKWAAARYQQERDKEAWAGAVGATIGGGLGTAAGWLGRALWGGTRLAGRGLKGGAKGLGRTEKYLWNKGPVGKATAIGGTTAAGVGGLGTAGAASGYLSADTKSALPDDRDFSGFAKQYRNPGLMTPGEASYEYSGGTLWNPVNWARRVYNKGYNTVRESYDPDYAQYRQGLSDARQLTPEAMRKSRMNAINNSPASQMDAARVMSRHAHSRRMDLLNRLNKIRNLNYKLEQGQVLANDPDKRQRMLETGQRRLEMAQQRMREAFANRSNSL